MIDSRCSEQNLCETTETGREIRKTNSFRCQDQYLPSNDFGGAGYRFDSAMSSVK